MTLSSSISPPQVSDEFSSANEMHKASVVLSSHPADYDVVSMHKIDDFSAKSISQTIDEHELFDNMEADLYQYCLLSETKRMQSAPFSADTLFEIQAVLAHLSDLGKTKPAQNLYEYNIFDNEDLVAALQRFCCVSRLLDRVLWLVSLPHTLQTSWSHLCQKSEIVAEIFFSAQSVVRMIGKDNAYVQEYLARGKLTGYRTLSLSIADDTFESPEAVSTMRRGYFSTFAMGLLVDQGRESSSQLLQDLLFRNKRLSPFFTCTRFIQFIVDIMRRHGPSKYLLQLLACIVSGANNKNTLNGEIVLQVMCSTHEDPFYLDNRGMTLIETMQYPNPCGPIYVTWNGSPRYTSDEVDVDYFFFDPKTLGLPSTEISVPSELKSYFDRRGFSRSSVEAVLLEDLAWYVDPSYYFTIGDGGAQRRQWSLEVMRHKDDQEFIVNTARLHELACHYLGVIHLFTNLCKDRY